MLKRGTERNQRGIFRKMLKRGTSTFKLTMDKYRDASINIFSLILSDIAIYIQGYKHILRTMMSISCMMHHLCIYLVLCGNTT